MEFNVLGSSSIWMCRISNVCFDFFQLRQPEENNNIGNLTRQNGWATKDIRPKKLLGVWKQSASRNKNNQKCDQLKFSPYSIFLNERKVWLICMLFDIETLKTKNSQSLASHCLTWIWMTKRPGATSYNGFIFKKPNEN